MAILYGLTSIILHFILIANVHKSSLSYFEWKSKLSQKNGKKNERANDSPLFSFSQPINKRANDFPFFFLQKQKEFMLNFFLLGHP